MFKIANLANTLAASQYVIKVYNSALLQRKTHTSSLMSLFARMMGSFWSLAQ